SVGKHYKMKRAILVTALLIVNLTLLGQIDETYFLLGAQRDYLGRTFFKNHPTLSDLVLQIHEDNSGEIKRIEEITGLKFYRNEPQNECINCKEFFELRSAQILKKLSSFYSIKRWSVDDLGNRLDKGRIKCKKILSSTKNQKMSFLAGQFLISGSIADNSYKISLSNSPIRFECLCEILKELDCSIITKEFHYRIPNVHNVFFLPSDGVKELLDNEIEKRNTLAIKT
ncbi:hypothetical protein O3Q51_18395, partial [Cryomorphaceae bacterium 1068]|nr:hypothetical protein [Cryomorphaceae bacterium 1068]